jgi:hypothetical protein
VNPNQSLAIILFPAARFVLIPLALASFLSPHSLTRFTILPPTSSFFRQGI